VSKRFAETCGAMGDTPETGSGFKTFLQDVCAQIANSLCGALGESAQTIDTLRTEKTDLEGRLVEMTDRAANKDKDPHRDSLTGLLNKHGFMPAVRQALSSTRLCGGECALAFVDVDEFKAINEKHGHEAGDAALRRVAEALGATLKAHGAIVGRLGGDEFGFLLAPPTETVVVADRFALRRDVARALTGLSITLETGAAVTFSCSLGLVWLGVPEAGADLDATLQRAERLTQDAKRGGKGRVCEADARQAA